MAGKELTVLDRAITFAVEKHSGQNRKGTNMPYILHPLETAAVVGTMTDDLEILAAAVLHDVAEDAKVPITEIRALFGDKVAELVDAESENKREEQSESSTWKIRKSETLHHLQTATMDEMMITLGDKLSNIRSISRDYDVLGEDLWERFNQKDMEEHAWYYRSIAEALKTLSFYPAYHEYLALVNKVFG